MVTCPQCGREFVPVEDQRFCAFCGIRLEAATEDTNARAPRVEPDFSAIDEMLRDDPSESVPSSEPLPSKPVLLTKPDEQRPSDRSVPGLEREEDSFEPLYPWSRHLADRQAQSPLHEGYCPWEDQEKLGFFQGVGRTVYETFVTPGEFFARMPVKGGMLIPLLYALIVSTTGTMAGYLWLFALDNPVLASVKAIDNFTVILGVLTPVVVFVSIIGWAAIVHGCLYLLGGARRDFEATFRVVCYASGPELWNIVPLIGGYISYGWRLYLCVVGLREVHGLSTGRALAAVLVPGLGCLFSVVGFVFLLKAVADAAVK
jgi:hypothetical protein